MAHLKYVADNTENTLVTMQDFGFLLRQDSTAYSVGDTVFCSALPSGLLLECITAGTSASSVPNLSGATVDGTVTDGTVTWLVQKFSNSDSGNGSGVEIGDVSSFTAVGKHGRVLLTWTDPSDVMVEGVTLARWKGTLIVRKAGSAPSDKFDGVVVVDSLSRNAYASTPLEDTGLTDGTVYYYRAFPHTTGSTYTIGSSVSGTPNKETVALPVFSGSLSYTGEYQLAVFTGFDSAKMTKTGDLGGTNAGSYTTTFTLTDSDYAWPNGDSVGTVSWDIGKVSCGLSLSESTVELDELSLTGTVTASYAGDGVLSAVSSDTDIATVSVSGKVITVTSVGEGTAMITVSVGAGTNHLAGSDSFSVSISLVSVLNKCTWAEIASAAVDGTASSIWDIGDCKEITLNGNMGDYLTMSNLTLYVYILDFNHTEGSKGNLNGNHIVFGGFKTALTEGTDVALCDWSHTKTYGGYTGTTSSGYTNYTAGSKHFRFNRCDNTSIPYGGNYGGWKGSDLRYDILGATSTQPTNYNTSNATSRSGYDATSSTLSSPVSNTFMSCIPAALRSVIKLRNHWVDNVGGGGGNTSSNVTSVKDACFLLSEYEVQGARTQANSTEQSYQSQMQYYTNGNSKIKYNHQNQSTAVSWWCCSPYYGSTYDFCLVSTSGSASYYYARNALGVAPAYIV